MKYSTYNITYPDLDCTQSKILVFKIDYDQYKSDKMLISSFDEQLNNKKTPKEEKERIKEYIKNFEVKWKDLKNPYFVEGSPLYIAIETGIIHIEKELGNAGDYKVIIS